MGFKNNDRCLAKVADDEPIFVLRAQDLSAPGKIEEWINDNRDTLEADHLVEAQGVADAMRAWQKAHPDRAKWPD